MNNILAVDIEATCDNTKGWNRHNKPEIIEIGIVEIEASNFRIMPRDRFLVKPVKTKVTDYCTMLTGLTQEELDQDGLDFPTVCQRIKSKLNAEKKTWISFGNWDKKIFRRTCFENNIEFPFGDQYYDVQHFTQTLLHLRNQRSLPETLKLFGMEFEGTPHSGVDDAKNAARIFVRLLQGNLPTTYRGT